ncbi:MAG: T9SS type A sorting domain-containing protein [Candidatus Eisenbacteria bacterium]|nr:T9SS type A sorting domain-containing protein [Candidatus Eisenbacteria bacterium]
MHRNHHRSSSPEGFGSRTSSIVRAGLLTLSATIALSSGSFAASAFTTINETSIAPAGARYAAPLAYSTYRIDLGTLASSLVDAPLVRSSDSRPEPVIQLPMPDGSMQSFRVSYSPVMHRDLAAKYPEIRTFEAHGIDDTSAFARFSISPLGFHGTIWNSQGSIWIDPYQSNDISNYSVCWGRDYRRADMSELTGIGCETEHDPVEMQAISERVREFESRGGSSTGETLRTYRTAVAATGEYTAFHGGTVPLGLAAVVVAMNRCNGVYQRDFSVFCELVPNNDLVIYTNGGTDPYTNNNGGTMLTQNQANLNAVIGNANYDFGHVFSTGGGGIASLSSVCVSTRKAQGVTGLNTPIGDNFYIDYVAHEQGHQMGATHTFNSQNGSCGGGNRSAGTAFEPGSGTTIMSYAGICGADNIQAHSDDYFHVGSFVQIRSYMESGGGNACAATSPTGNLPPTADAAIGTFTIPLSTPFQLTGSGSDPDDDPLTYCWEEYDLGPAGPPNSPSGNAPIFRSFDPTTSPTRYFPRMSDIVNNVQTKGEIKASYARTLKFRLTVRDGFNGVNWAEAPLITVSTAGPFLVTSPNTSGIQWGGGSSQTVTWDVASTNIAPVNCASVNILLSEDGGFTYPHTLATGVANDGSESVILPLIETLTARIKVEAADNIFFDISNANFEITPGTTDAPELAFREGEMLRAAEPNPTRDISHIRFRLAQNAPVTLKVYGADGREVATLADGTMEAGEYMRAWDGRDYDSRPTPAGVYYYRLTAGNRTESKQLVRIN